MLDIKVSPDEIWEFFQVNKDRLSNEMYLIAEDDLDCIEVYVAAEKGLPYFTVEVDGDITFKEPTVSELDAVKTYQKILKGIGQSSKESRNKGSEDEFDLPFEESDIDIAIERNDEIHMAAYDYLSILLQEDPEAFGFDLDEIETFTLTIEKMLLDNFAILVEHPKMNEEGTKVLSQYSIDFDEDDFDQVL